ncbi:carbohydrate ABC transporter permease [Vagococcus sp.]|uniref:carbohydrate ABC transporter permease n=1 Tax=Vagococcus sp. TaxID=1933889 RepID=UPI003F9C61B6
MRLKKYKKEEVFWGWLLIAPTLIGLFVLNIKPAIDTFILSFQQSGGFGRTKWVGFENYQKLIKDPEVLQAVINTLVYTLIAVPFIIVLSLLAAVLLNQKIKGRSIYRTLYFLPVVSTPAAVAMIWKWLFNPDYGLINLLLAKIGLTGPNWLTNPHTSLLAIAVVGIWSTIGYNMVLLLSGLQEIPKDYYESAELDGAGAVKQFFSITLPLVTPTLFFVMVTTIINSLQVFDLIFMMIDKTNVALPKTQSLVYLFYKQSFIMNDKGYGSAIVMVLLLIIMIITAIQMKIQKKWVNY